ncbi:hypothetical protein FHS19_003220 [Paenibacillus rhizosphaerae]|uniref:Uncharacterized protein n=1 Tax=Paenibacillus rhizosphaerae TaxID=297318 RepID=A0A839TP31_9BACL|nr:hypothetical protein [Paenibacillus rhizosphaerae]MBB3128566.1 hypothetical protein [Paenibacillus rhizosphaerae]
MLLPISTVQQAWDNRIRLVTDYALFASKSNKTDSELFMNVDEAASLHVVCERFKPA